MKFSNKKVLTTRLLVALAMAFVGAAGLSGTAEAGDTSLCLSCHAPVGTTDDIRPVDSSYRNISTGGFRGSHTKHIPAKTTLASQCTSCHGDAVASYAANHRDGFINVTSAASNDYSKGTRFAQSGSRTLTLGTCSTASCHDNGKGVLVTTPAWGAAAVPACSVCHAAVPATNSHTKHLSGTSYKAAVCADCHNGTVESTTANAANHGNGGNGTVDVFKNLSGDLGYPSHKAKGSALGTCTTAYCHSSGQSADGSSNVPVYAAVTWGGSAACGTCHATTGMTTGSHTLHIASDTNCGKCHDNATLAAYNSTKHADGSIDVATAFNYAKQGTPGNGYSSCTTTVCHGTSATPVWGADTTAATCTKCHGTPTVTVTAANRYVVAPSASGPFTNNTGHVSATDQKIGAHQTHLRMSNGISAVGTFDERCQNCHGTLPTAGNHATGSATPSFQGLATKSGAMTASYTSGTATCNNTYCHNPASANGSLDPANFGTGISPVWTDSGYIADGTLKTQYNCGRCHKSPGDAGFTSNTLHDFNITQDCKQCHSHNGDTQGITGRQHMDGVFYASGGCDTCHGYPPMTQAQLDARESGTYLSASLENYSGGGGYHGTHLLATVSAVEGFTPCLPCHPSTSHKLGGGTVHRANVNVFDATATGYRFDGTRSKRYNSELTQCSNISCHFKPSPVWKSASPI